MSDRLLAANLRYAATRNNVIDIHLEKDDGSPDWSAKVTAGDRDYTATGDCAADALQNALLWVGID